MDGEVPPALRLGPPSPSTPGVANRFKPIVTDPLGRPPAPARGPPVPASSRPNGPSPVRGPPAMPPPPVRAPVREFGSAQKVSDTHPPSQTRAHTHTVGSARVAKGGLPGAPRGSGAWRPRGCLRGGVCARRHVETRPGRGCPKARSCRSSAGLVSAAAGCAPPTSQGQGCRSQLTACRTAPPAAGQW